MILKKFLLTLLIIYLIAGCSALKTSQVPPSDTNQKTTSAENYMLEGEDTDSLLTMDDVKLLKKLFSNSLKSKKEGDKTKALEFLEEALVIISNNEIKSKEIYKNDDDYNEIVDFILDEYKSQMNEQLTFDKKIKRSLSTKIESDKKTTYKSKYKPLSLFRNSRVDNYIKYYQGKGRKYFTLYLQRMGKYKHLLKKVLREEGLPEDIIYLAMVESGFNPNAYSRAGAVGIWQFIRSTGRIYGLTINNYIDERRDPEKSTRAAAKFLKRLYAELDDWYLTMAAYNFSKRKLVRAMRRHKTRDFWKLRTIPRETRNHIPKIIAAAIISKNPSAYGFRNIQYMKPISYDKVHIDKCIDLAVASKCAKADYLELKSLNPELRTWFTPPYPDGYTLKIPSGTKETFKKNYAAVPDKLKVSKVIHRVRRGETLSLIARRYHTTIHNIKSVNSLRSIHRLSIGQKLVIPAPPKSEIAYRNKYKKRQTTSYSSTPKNKENYKKVTYRIKKGDTLSEIAEKYNTTATSLKRWNNLAYKRFIYPGQKITIWVKKNTSPGIFNFGSSVTYAMERDRNNSSDRRIYVVKRGDTLWQIAREHGVKLNKLLKHNNKSKRSIIKPGEKIIIPSVE